MSHSIPIKQVIEYLQFFSDTLGEDTAVCVPDDEVLVNPVVAQMNADGPAGIDESGELIKEEIYMVVILPEGHPSLSKKENDA
jgi:hypothetical protein